MDWFTSKDVKNVENKIWNKIAVKIWEYSTACSLYIHGGAGESEKSSLEKQIAN